MPIVIAWLMAALETTAGSIIISALLSLGLSFASYKFTVAPLKNLVLANLSGAPAILLNVIGWVRLDVAFTMVLSAYAARWAVGGAVSLIRAKSGS